MPAEFYIEKISFPEEWPSAKDSSLLNTLPLSFCKSHRFQHMFLHLVFPFIHESLIKGHLLIKIYGRLECRVDKVLEHKIICWLLVLGLMSPCEIVDLCSY